MGLHILNDEGEPQLTEDLIEWAIWKQVNTAIVLQDWPRRDVRVSTIFLGVDFDHLRVGTPVLWETMIFGGPFTGFQWRYRSKLEALQGHARLLALAEVFGRAPRTTKKALRKFGQHDPMTAGEGRRVHRAMARAGWLR